MSGPSQYLLVLYIAEQHESGPIPSGDIAAALGRSPAAATEMLQRLEERGLVTLEPYEGARLTADGRETAKELHDTYVTLSQFFDEVLGLDNHDEEAIQVAGSISPLVADRLASALLAEAETDRRPDDAMPSFLPTNNS
jgi:Mn-dependent DtxR family transcriptional regulator